MGIDPGASHLGGQIATSHGCTTRMHELATPPKADGYKDIPGVCLDEMDIGPVDVYTMGFVSE